MAFLFKRSPKTPAELVRAINEQLAKVGSTGDPKKAQDELTRYLKMVKVLLDGEIGPSGRIAPHPDQIAQLAREVYNSDCLLRLLEHLDMVAFDSRKIVVELFNCLLRRRVGDRSPTIDYILRRPQILAVLMKGPENPETCLTTGQMLREAIKDNQVARLMITSENFWEYVQYCTCNNFETSTDALSTLTQLLTDGQNTVLNCLSLKGMNRFQDCIKTLISYPNYVTKRESLKLLSKILLTRGNKGFMKEYVKSAENLKTVMTLLSDKSRNIQMEAFNVFKIFVANPYKSKGVTDILVKNRVKLTTFLAAFNSDQRFDDEFDREKAFIMDQIEIIPGIVAAQQAAQRPERAGSASSTEIAGPATEYRHTHSHRHGVQLALHSPLEMSAQNVYEHTKEAFNSAPEPPVSGGEPQITQ